MRYFKKIILWLCVYLFIMRVMGQVLVGVYQNTGGLSHLASWDHWYSGLLPYPLLLLSQVLIIQLMTLMAYDSSRQKGFFLIESIQKQLVVRIGAIIYFLAMIVRVIWFNTHHYIPIIFHCILALFLFVCSFADKQPSQRKT